jgi:predicted GIY-YIG superfamily endonuclease
MNFYIYILKCADDSYYTGHTDDLEKRIAQHQQRYFKSCYTANRLPVELIYCQGFPTREEALASERQIKGWSRKKKEAMMRGDWNEVSRLAQNTLRHTSARLSTGAQGERSNSAHSKTINSPNHGEPDSSSVHAEPEDSSVRAELVEAKNAPKNNKNGET